MSAAPSQHNKEALSHSVLTQTNVNLCIHNFTRHSHIDVFTQHCTLNETLFLEYGYKVYNGHFLSTQLAPSSNIALH